MKEFIYYCGFMFVFNCFKDVIVVVDGLYCVMFRSYVDCVFCLCDVFKNQFGFNKVD